MFNFKALAQEKDTRIFMIELMKARQSMKL